MLLRGSVFPISKSIVRGTLKPLRNDWAKGAIVSISTLGIVPCASRSRSDGDVGVPWSWWCSQLSSAREGRMWNRCLSSSASTKITAMPDDNDLNEEHPEGHPIDRQARWDRMFAALEEYKSMNGDTLVPAAYPENPQLGNWVDNKRQLFRMRLAAEADGNYYSQYHRLLTDEKIEELNSIEFVWSLYEHSWNIRYHEMKEYLDEHGNALVPSEYPQNVALGQWVMQQRRNYKRAQGVNMKYNETTLSADRIEKLNEIGFVWDVHEAQWYKRLEELKAYMAYHGDTLVPKTYSAQPSSHYVTALLGRWVDKQRLDYRRFMAKKKIKEEWSHKEIVNDEDKKEMERVKKLSTGMTEERIRLLEAEDFIWDVNRYVWDSKFEELCNFVGMNGHAAIFRRSNEPYDPLARWADVQRGNYKKYKKGQKTSLTRERIERLNSVNFLWENPKKGKKRKAAKP